MRTSPRQLYLWTAFSFLVLLRVSTLSAQDTCSGATFNSPRTLQLFPPGTVPPPSTTLVVNTGQGHYTAFTYQSAAPYALTSTTPNYEIKLRNCFAGAPAAGQPHSQFPTVSGTASQMYAVGSFAGSGSIGVAILGNLPSQILVLTQKADGTLLSEQYGTGVGPVAVLTADLNGDNKPDLIVVRNGDLNKDPGGISVFLGNGDGTFHGAQTYAAGNAPVSVTAADLNGDNKLDLIVTNGQSGDISVLLGKGDGSFQLPVNLPIGPGLTSLAAADWNGDGKMDLAVTSSTTSLVSILLGNGDGTFQPIRTSDGMVAGGYVAAGDFNGDGKPDLAVGGANSDVVAILTGNGDGSFRAPRAYVTGAPPTEFIVTDVNNDGYSDIVVATGNSQAFTTWHGTISVLIGNGDGTFQSAPFRGMGQSPADIASADFNGDGRADLVVVDPVANQAYLLFGLPGGDFQTPQPFSLTGASNVIAADFNRDGSQDLAVIAQNRLAVLFGHGDGTFQAANNRVLPTSANAMTAADVNGDGYLDLIVTAGPDRSSPNPDNGSVNVFLGRGNGDFLPPVAYTAGSSPHWAVVGDFNGDGKMDLAVACVGHAPSDPGGVSIFLGNGDGTFSNPVTYAAGVGPSYLVAADLNGDHKLDLAVATGGATAGDYRVAVLLGVGDGTFQPATLPVTSASPAAILARDFNGDGKMDLVVSHCCGAASMSYFLGNGDGTFQAEVPFGGGSNPARMLSGDFNGDGKPDLAIVDTSVNSASGGAVVLLNESTAQPVPAFTNVSGASFVAGPLAPEEIVTAEGAGLAAAPATSSPPQTSVGGVTVTVTDAAGVARPAVLYYVSPTQVNYVMPKGMATGTATVSLTNGSQTGSAQAQIAAVAPSVFTLNTKALAAATLQRIRNGISTFEQVYQVDSSGNVTALPINLGPAGDQLYLSLYGTGIRNVSGAAAVTVMFGSIQVAALSAGAQPTYPGLDQVNVLLPTSLRGMGAVSVVLNAQGLAANTVQLVFQ